MKYDRFPTNPEHTAGLEDKLKEFTRTTEFKAWFGDWEQAPETASKLVDENGRPLVVYSGLPAGIKRLSGDKRVLTGPDELGFYFTKRYPNARSMAEQRRDPFTDEPIPSSVYAAFLNIRSPRLITPNDRLRSTRVIRKPSGVDGLINDQLQEIVVFDPEQILFIEETRIN